MKKAIITILIVGALFLLFMYSVYYNVFQKSEIRITGFDFRDKDGELKITERVGLKVAIRNNSMWNANIGSLQITFLDQNKITVGVIEPIRNLSIPKGEKVEFSVFLNSVDVTKVITDIARGQFKNYKYRVKMVFFGVLYFQTTRELI